MNENKVTSWYSGVLIDIEVREKAMKKYGNGNATRAEAIRRAIEDAVKDVKLTRSELAAIRLEVEENYRKRMAKREAAKAAKAERSAR